jgi:hypothetical protein
MGRQETDSTDASSRCGVWGFGHGVEMHIEVIDIVWHILILPIYLRLCFAVGIFTMHFTLISRLYIAVKLIIV